MGIIPTITSIFHYLDKTRITCTKSGFLVNPVQSVGLCDSILTPYYLGPSRMSHISYISYCWYCNVVVCDIWQCHRLCGLLSGVMTWLECIKAIGFSFFTSPARLFIGVSPALRLRISKFLGLTWDLVGPRWAPCWPHEPCYHGRIGLPATWQIKSLIRLKTNTASKWLQYSKTAHIKASKT